MLIKHSYTIVLPRDSAVVHRVWVRIKYLGEIETPYISVQGEVLRCHPPEFQAWSHSSQWCLPFFLPSAISPASVSGWMGSKICRIHFKTSWMLLHYEAVPEFPRAKWAPSCYQSSWFNTFIIALIKLYYNCLLIWVIPLSKCEQVEYSLFILVSLAPNTLLGTKQILNDLFFAWKNEGIKEQWNHKILDIGQYFISHGPLAKPQLYGLARWKGILGFSENTTDWLLKQQKFIFHDSRDWEVQVQGAKKVSFIGRLLLWTSRLLPSHCVLMWPLLWVGWAWWQKASSLVSHHKDHHSIIWAPLSRPHLTLITSQVFPLKMPSQGFYGFDIQTLGGCTHSVQCQR